MERCSGEPVVFGAKLAVPVELKGGGKGGGTRFGDIGTVRLTACLTLRPTGAVYIQKSYLVYRTGRHRARVGRYDMFRKPPITAVALFRLFKVR